MTIVEAKAIIAAFKAGEADVTAEKVREAMKLLSSQWARRV